MKGAVRRAESQGAMVGGGRNGRKGGGDECKIEDLKKGEGGKEVERAGLVFMSERWRESLHDSVLGR